MKRASLPLAAAIALASLVATAPAAAPAPDTYRIVPGRSIGGVALNALSGQAKRAWGPTRGECAAHPFLARVRRCTYLVNGRNERRGGGHFSFPSGSPSRVFAVEIRVGIAGGAPNFNTPMTRFVTRKGIRLGSRLSKVRTAYPGGVLYPGSAYAISRQDPQTGINYDTWFYVRNGRVVTISIEKFNLAPPPE